MDDEKDIETKKSEIATMESKFFEKNRAEREERKRQTIARRQSRQTQKLSKQGTIPESDGKVSQKIEDTVADQAQVTLEENKTAEENKQVLALEEPVNPQRINRITPPIPVIQEVSTNDEEEEELPDQVVKILSHKLSSPTILTKHFSSSKKNSTLAKRFSLEPDAIVESQEESRSTE